MNKEKLIQFPENSIPRVALDAEGQPVLNVAAALRLIEEMEMTWHPYYVYLKNFSE